MQATFDIVTICMDRQHIFHSTNTWAQGVLICSLSCPELTFIGFSQPAPIRVLLLEWKTLGERMGVIGGLLRYSFSGLFSCWIFLK